MSPISGLEPWIFLLPVTSSNQKLCSCKQYAAQWRNICGGRAFWRHYDVVFNIIIKIILELHFYYTTIELWCFLVSTSAWMSWNRQITRAVSNWYPLVIEDIAASLSVSNDESEGKQKRMLNAIKYYTWKKNQIFAST